MRSRRIALSALALALTIPVTALAADEKGAEGKAKSVEINAPTSDTFLQFHGRLFVKSGKTTTEYRWGGTSCGSKTMSAEMIELLVSVVRTDDVRIVPSFQDGQGSAKCLVGFTIKDADNKGKDNDKDDPQ
jgi:hypothetical protein